MSSKSITVTEAIHLLKTGKKIGGLTIEFKEGEKVRALDAFQLGKAGIEVPDEVIEYNDMDVAYDPDFDDQTWERTDLDPFKTLKEKLTIDIEIEKDIKVWIQKNDIEVHLLIEKLVRDFYAASQMIKRK